MDKLAEQLINVLFVYVKDDWHEFKELWREDALFYEVVKFVWHVVK